MKSASVKRAAHRCRRPCSERVSMGAPVGGGRGERSKALIAPNKEEQRRKSKLEKKRRREEEEKRRRRK